MQTSYPLRPFLPADTMALRDLFAQSIEELTAEDYNEDQRLAWVTRRPRMPRPSPSGCRLW